MHKTSCTGWHHVAPQFQHMVANLINSCSLIQGHNYSSDLSSIVLTKFCTQNRSSTKLYIVMP